MSLSGSRQCLKVIARPSDKEFRSTKSTIMLEIADFPICPRDRVAHLCWSHSVVITILNQSVNHANQYPACTHWKYCLVPKYWAFSEGDVDNYWGVTRYHLKILHHVRDSSGLTQGVHRHLLKAITSKEDCALLRIMRRKSFLSVFRIRVGVIRQTGRLSVRSKTCLSVWSKSV